MKPILTFNTLLAALTIPAAADPATDGSSEAKKLVGIYRIASGTMGEQAIPQERLEGTVRWGINSISGYDEDKNELYASTYQLDTTTEPWEIKLVGTMVPSQGDEDPQQDAEVKRFESQGLVKQEGDKVTLIYSTKDGIAPDDFEPGEDEHKFVFEKVAHDGDTEAQP